MNEKLAPYVGFAEKMSVSKYETQKLEESVDALSGIDEFRDLSSLISGYQETVESVKSGKFVVNPASLYDRTLSIRDISSKFDTESTREVLEISNQTLASADKLLTFDETNVHLFDYYDVLSDMTFVSEAMSEVCGQVGANQNTAQGLDKYGDILNDSVDGILIKIGKMFGSIKETAEGIFSSIGQRLKDAFSNLKNFLKTKVVDNIIEGLKKAGEVLNKMKLWLLKSMFRFVGQVAKLAKENGWNVTEINVEMPDIGVKIEKIGPIPIPIPQITSPKVRMNFSQLERVK